jgi:hypothetical protein
MAARGLDEVEVLEQGGLRREADERRADAHRHILSKLHNTQRAEQVFYRHLTM